MTRTLRIFALALVATMAALLSLAAPDGALAQAVRTISNVATAEWGAPGNRIQMPSNRVDTIVALPAQPIISAPFRIADGGPTAALLESSCSIASLSNEGSSLVGPVTLSGHSISGIDQILAGQPLVLGVDRPALNRDSAVIETVRMIVTTVAGDSEALTFVETAAASGRFVAIVRTYAAPPVTANDCRLGVTPGAETIRFSDTPGGPIVTSFTIRVLIDPYGIAFDSRDGTPISGVSITLINVATGQPAQVFGDDGFSIYPSTVITGRTVTDSGGTVYTFPPGDYRFPLVAPGTYRLVVTPIAPYTAPSTATPADIAPLRRPDGSPFAISTGSYGQSFTLSDPAPVRIDIPLDRPLTPMLVAKTASISEAEAGDVVQYRVAITNPDLASSGALTVRDVIPAQMRYRLGSARFNGVAIADPVVSGRQLAFTLPALARQASGTLTYLLEVRPDANEGDALNRVTVIGAIGNASNTADALVRIRRETIGQRLTLIGRVIDAPCGVDPSGKPGIPGVRVMMEDGSYTVTDRDGRYHFEGVRPGTHVVQIDPETLPADRAPVDCAANLRSGGSAISRFVDGFGGALKKIDFHAAPSTVRANSARAQAVKPVAATDQSAAGADRDWFANQQPGVGFLFPEPDHNPRAPAVRVAIKHLPGQTVRLKRDGKPVEAVAFEGVRTNSAGTIAVSLWRGVPIENEQSTLIAEILDIKGSVVETMTRPIHFANSAVRAEIVPGRSRLVADGVTRPVIALRLTDARGRPVHHGLAGDFSLPAPYLPAIEADAAQARQLAGLERARPTWRVTGDDGIALVELEPTTASGSVVLNFNFRDGQRARAQRLEAWLDPGQRAWTIVGLAEGTVGFNKLDKHLEGLGASGDKGDKSLVDGRLALYAKGRILGKWLLTVAYDSDKAKDEARFAGTIDPTAYYTVYADRSEQRYDAASIRKLYLKLERPQFYALFGDYDTGIDEPKLARYVRSFNGAKAEHRSAQVSAVAFAADTPTRHRRDEIQGNGLSGPYVLGSRNLLANSERIVIETRDRLRSDRIVDSRQLIRHIDYDIDYAAGTLRFREAILSRNSSGDPILIVADYEVDGVANRRLNAGGRIAVRTKDQKLQIGATVIHDADGDTSTNLVGADLKYRPTEATEIRAEIAVSKTKSDGVPSTATAVAWLIEAEHHAGKLDLLAYLSQRDQGFGLGQTNAVETATRKAGIDARLKLSKTLEASASAWREESLTSDARRTAGRVQLEYRDGNTSARIGLVHAADTLADGREATSTLLQLGASRRLMKGKLELDAQSEIPIGGKDESIDFPARHKLDARLAVSRAVALVASYEIAKGDEIDARTARLGFDLQPWAGARIALAGNMQDIAEYGPRSFASFGLAQSLVVSKNLTVDATLDGNRTIGGIDPARVLNPLHPVASGGFIGGGALTEDFLAMTAGATWRSDRWSITGRAEYRDGEEDNRYGLTLGALRQIGEGRAVGGSLNWFTAEGRSGVATRTLNAQIAWAHRPADSEIALLDKLEVRHDSVTGAVAGEPGPLGLPLDVVGDARSTRIVNSLSFNWTPRSGRNGWLDRSEIALFWGTRYTSDRYGRDDVKGWSNVLGADIRFDLGERFEIGFAGTARIGLDADARAFAGGPQFGFRPFDNGWLQLGWNVVGFSDRDFSENRYTRDGPYVTARFKFDQTSLAGLGIGGK